MVSDVNMKQVSVLLPASVIDELRKLKEEKKIKSISEFLRNLIIYAMYYGSRNTISYRRVTVEEWRMLPMRDIDELRKETRVGYGEHHSEIMKQLREALKNREKRLANTVS